MFPRFRAAETMTKVEQARLLRVTATHNGPRDHVLYSMALGAGLRLRELLGLNVGDVSPDGQQIRRRIVLQVTRGGHRGEVYRVETEAGTRARMLNLEGMRQRLYRFLTRKFV